MWLDAFRTDYLNKFTTPFIYQLSKEGLLGEYKPLLAFEGIGVSIVTGVSPLTHGVWTQFCLNPENSPFKWTEKTFQLNRFLDIFTSKSGVMERLGKAALNLLVSSVSKRFSRRKKMPRIPMIPIQNLHFFDTALTTSLFDEDALAVPTIFDILRTHDIPFKVVSGLRDSEAFKKTIKINKDTRFVFAHFVNPDTVGHKVGPCSERIYRTVHDTDHKVMKIVKEYRKKFDTEMFIFSDHGMAEVKKTINILALLRRLGLKEGRDFVVFLDSTMARFWTQKKECKRRILEALDGIQGGKTLSANDLKHYLIPNDRKYGDIIWLADHGTLILPNYYQGTKPIKGMHGYAPGSKELMSPIIIYSEDLPSGKIQRIATPMDILPTILDLMGIDTPGYVEGKSLLT